MQIILVEDEEIVNDVLKTLLESDGHEVHSFKNLKTFFSEINNLNPDLIIADIALPDGNFLEEMQKHPEIKENTKLFIISGKTEIDNIRKSFNLGADDFIKKPFDYEEILLRIKKTFYKKNEKITDDIEYNYESKTIIKGDERVILSKKESQLLELFLKNRGKILSNDYIINELWDEEVENNTLTVLIKRLREKLGDKKIIASKRNLGYIMF